LVLAVVGSPSIEDDGEIDAVDFVVAIEARSPNDGHSERLSLAATAQPFASVRVGDIGSSSLCGTPKGTFIGVPPMADARNLPTKLGYFGAIYQLKWYITPIERTTAHHMNNY